MTSTNTCIVIVGPTAVGKTSFAIKLAKQLQTQIISADSRQCYRELDIGVGKPSYLQLQEVQHYFINSHSVTAQVNAALFEQYALEAAAEIFTGNKVAIVAGGTGLYVDAFCNGMDDVPLIVPEVRESITASYKERGFSWLQEAVSNADPDFYEQGEILNPQRLMRALEVKLSTGRSLKSYHTGQKTKRPFSIIKIGLELPRDLLYHQINRRVDEMVSMGLEEEVKSVVSFKHLNALNTVGYKEMFQYIDGAISLAEAIALIQKNTRHYAKRQMTWFKRDINTHWVGPGDDKHIVDLLKV